MTQLLKIPTVWDLLRRFEKTCRTKGWKTLDHENLIEVAGEYHNFIGTRTTHLSTFTKINASKKCAVPEGKSYRVIDVSYTAWAFQEQPPKQLLEFFTDNTEYARRTAIYDLSRVCRGKPLCMKWNETDSIVFSEFERFLKETCQVEMKWLWKPKTIKTKTFKPNILGVSLS